MEFSSLQTTNKKILNVQPAVAQLQPRILEDNRASNIQRFSGANMAEVAQRQLNPELMKETINNGDKQTTVELLEKVSGNEIGDLVGIGYTEMVSLFRKVFIGGVDSVSSKAQQVGVQVLLYLEKNGELHQFSSDASPTLEYLLNSKYAKSNDILVQPIEKSLTELDKVSSYFTQNIMDLQKGFLESAEEQVGWANNESQLDRRQERSNAILFDVNFYKKQITKEFDSFKGNKTVELADDFILQFKDILKHLQDKLTFQINNDITILSDQFVINPDSRREWSQEELESVLPVIGRLPKKHVQGNEKLKGFKRQDTYPPNPKWGAFYSYDSSEMTLTDAAFKNATYRATGMTSKLGGHQKGNLKMGKGPVTPIDEALTHEIGHSVHEKYDQQFMGFEKLAGWQLFKSADETAQYIFPDVKESSQQKSLLIKLNQLLVNQNYEINGRVIRRISESKFSVRDLGSLPTDTHKGSKADNSLFDYAQEMSKEHFAETYTHMVNIPEEMYYSYVVEPREQYEEYQKIADEAYINKSSKKETADFYKKKMFRLQGIWDLMKRAIFEVDDKPVYELAELMEKAGISKVKIEEFLRQADQVATPYQQNQLIREYEKRYQSDFQDYYLEDSKRILKSLPDIKQIKQELREKILKVEGSSEEKKKLLMELDSF